MEAFEAAMERAMKYRTDVAAWRRRSRGGRRRRSWASATGTCAWRECYVEEGYTDAGSARGSPRVAGAGRREKVFALYREKLFRI